LKADHETFDLEWSEACRKRISRKLDGLPQNFQAVTDIDTDHSKAKVDSENPRIKNSLKTAKMGKFKNGGLT
jgi:hypothetical protein